MNSRLKKRKEKNQKSKRLKERKHYPPKNQKKKPNIITSKKKNQENQKEKKNQKEEKENIRAAILIKYKQQKNRTIKEETPTPKSGIQRIEATEATQPSTKEQHINPYGIQNRKTTAPNTPRNKKSQATAPQGNRPSTSTSTNNNQQPLQQQKQQKGQ